MEAMYAGLADGMDLDDALREAKLESLRRGEGPREWAAFVAIGDAGVRIPLSRPSGRGPWRVLFLFAVVLALLTYGWVRRKRTGSEWTERPSSNRTRTTQV